MSLKDATDTEMRRNARWLLRLTALHIMNLRGLVRNHPLIPILAILFGAVIGLNACRDPNAPPIPPFETPLALHQAGTVLETKFEIEEEDVITLELVFKKNGQPGEHDRLFKLLDDWGQPQIKIPLKVKITKYTPTGELTISDATHITTLSGYSVDAFFNLIMVKKVTPGNYKIRLETLQSFPQLSTTPVLLWVAYLRG